MRTKIVIKHETAEALKSSELWQQIMAVAFNGGPVEVVDIEAVDADWTDDDEREYSEREMEQLARDGQL